MRSLLPLDQQGEPAALVSAECEVIQINRKFFSKSLDDNMLSIIALKVKLGTHSPNIPPILLYYSGLVY